MPGRTPPRQPPQDLPRVKLWRLRHNPLRRPSDLVQAWIGLGLLLATLTATPCAMFLAGDATYRHYARTAQHQEETRHHTTAVLLENARRHPEPGSAEARETRYPAKVRFTDPKGHSQIAITDVQPGLLNGTTIRVWADDDGKITDPPLSSSQIRSRTMGAAAVGALAVHATAAAAYGVASRVIQRRNLAAWDSAWAETAPRWTTSQ